MLKLDILSTKEVLFYILLGLDTGKEADDMRFEASEDIYFSNWCNLE